MDIDSAKAQLMDKAVLAKFIVKPRDTIVELGLDPDDEKVAATFEPFLQQMNKAIAGVNRTISPQGAAPARELQGIGFGCCNTL